MPVTEPVAYRLIMEDECTDPGMYESFIEVSVTERSVNPVQSFELDPYVEDKCGGPMEYSVEEPVGNLAFIDEALDPVEPIDLPNLEAEFGKLVRGVGVFDRLYKLPNL